MKQICNSNSKCSIPNQQVLKFKTQQNQNPADNCTILSNERVIKSVEIDEPIPARGEPEQYRGPVERGGDRGRPLRVDEVGPAEDVHVLGGAEDGAGLDGEGEGVAVGLGREPVEVEEVVVPGVVDGAEQAEDPA